MDDFSNMNTVPNQNNGLQNQVNIAQPVKNEVVTNRGTNVIGDSPETNLAPPAPVSNTVEFQTNTAPATQVQSNQDNNSQTFISDDGGSIKKDRGAIGGLFKLIIMLIVPVTGIVITGTVMKARAENYQMDVESGVMMRIQMKDTNWKDIGAVFEPLITLPIKAQGTYQDWEFLLDSGAVISSLPRDWADKMGKDIDKMKRSVFKGFGSKTSFAYQGEMTVLIGEEDVDLPVVFTEASGTKSLIGRKGFFQEYSVVFNHKDKVIEIRK